MKKKRTIYTIAEELGLSPGTISKAINNKGKVSEETRNRIHEHIKKVGYVPSMSARMLKSKMTKTIGIVFTEELDIGLEHVFFSSILQHFKSHVENEGYELSFIVSKLGENKLSYLEWCLNKKVDGVFIVVGDYRDEGINELVNSPIPCVSTDMIVEGLHTIYSDNELGINLALDYAVNKLKRNNLAMIVGPQQSRAFEERYKAFKNYMDKIDIKLNENNLSYAQGFGFTSGFNATIDLFKKSNLDIDFLMVSSDDLALGVLKALEKLGKKVPDDVSVIGFDDLPVTRYVTPSLTTVKQDRKLLGVEAAKKLIKLIENPEYSQKDVTKIPVSLVIRESTK